MDTGHFLGGDLRGTRGTVISKPYRSNGKDGNPKGQRRVAVALEETGIVTVPVANLEIEGAGNRRAAVSGIGEGTLKRDGILRISTIRRGGKTFARTVYKDGRETLDPIG